ncbi:MAG: hypothetical protein QXH03_01485 [Candidatus Bathyarchaeia archaeon]
MTVQYVTASDVQNALNASYDSANHVYTVYGLTIAEASLQAHVDFANTYINALLGRDLTTEDPLYNVAKMAALDLACIRILVVSSGGAMIGAFDYFLGDLRVARAGPYAEAIERTIKGFTEDFHRQMTNLVKSAVAAEAAAKEEVPKYRGGLVSP